MRLLVLTMALVAAGCGGAPKLGGLELATDGSGVSVRDGTTELLDTFAGGSGAYAPVAVRADGRADIEERSGAFKFTEAPGTWLEAARFAWTDVQATSAKGAWRDAAGKVLVTLAAFSPARGELSLTWTASDPSVNRLSVAFSCREDDHFLGFGGQADAVDHRGHTIPLWTSEPGLGKRLADDDYPDLWFQEGTRHAASYGLPTWLSSRGFLGVVDTDRRSVFELCSVTERAFRVEVWDNHLTLWLFRGDLPKTTALAQATGRVLGRPLQPPAIAFAPWVDALFGSDNVRAVAKTLRDNGIPSSVIWTGDVRGGRDEGDSYRLGEEWGLDPALYPDAGALAAELKAQGFGWLATADAFIVEGTHVFEEASAGAHFVGSPAGGPALFSGPTSKPTGLADLTRLETREWVKSYLRRALDTGFLGWMADDGEWLPHDAVVASGEDPMELHNRWPRIWAKLSYDVLAERDDGTPRVVFARSGWLRSNTVTQVVWGGEQRTSFDRDDGLYSVVPMAINLGLAGVSTFGSDIGGHQSAANLPATKELFFRWTELGALSPVMRAHGGTQPRRQWRFDSDAETLAHFKRWARFHMQLFPYLDAHSAEAETTGTPIVRALALQFPEDAASWTISDEYLLGGAMVVAPVVDQGATSRAVHVPPGDWVSLSESLALPGGPYDYVAQAPLTEIPILLRAGAVIPRLPERTQTLLPAAGVADWNRVKNERSLLLVTGGSSTFTERDGTFYSVQLSASTTRYAQNGLLLGDCASASSRGCVDRAGPNVVVRMSSTGQLEVPGHVLVIDGQLRNYDVELIVPAHTYSP